MNPSFERVNDVVWLQMDSGLKTCKPFYAFSHECDSQETAELVTRQFNKELNKFYTKIASDPVYYLDSEEVSALKRKLQNWHGGKHCWK